MGLTAGRVFLTRGFIQQSQWRWWTSLLAAVAIYILSSAIGVAVGVVATLGTMPETGLPSGAALPVIDPRVLCIAIIAGQIVTILAVITLASLRSGDWFSSAYLTPVNLSAGWLIAFAVIAAALFGLDLIWQVLFSDILKADGADIVSLLRSPDTWLATLLAATVGAALSEELLFRGFLLPPLASTRLGFWGAAVLSSLLWTAIHGYSWQGAVEVFVFGLALSYLLWRTGSILPGMVLHSLINGTYAAVALWS